MNRIFRISILIIFITIVYSGCKQEEKKVVIQPKEEIQKLNETLKKFEEPSQSFKIPSDKPKQVKGKQGTIIFINPIDLETENGASLGKNIEIELKELTNQTQLLKSNAQTVSNGQLLISGGAYYINMTSDGQQLKLKESKTLKVEFPKLSNSEMSLFYGNRDSLGIMNWQQAEQKFAPKKSSKETVTKTQTYSELDLILEYVDSSYQAKPLTEKEKKSLELESKMYQAIQLQKFGWINCDRFYEIENKTNVPIILNNSDSLSNATIYLVFKDINSVMQNSWWQGSKNIQFENIPVGSKVRLVAFSIKDGQLLSYDKDITIQSNQSININLQPTPEEEIKKIFG